MNKVLLNSVVAVLVFLLVGLSNGQTAGAFSCSSGTTPEFEAVKELIGKVRESGAIPRSVKEDLIARYEKSAAMDKSILDGTHPICFELFEYNKEAEDYERARSSYEGEVPNYNSRCSGTLPEEQYRACMEWRSKLLAEGQRLIDWKAALDQRSDSINGRVDSLNEQNKRYDTQLLADMKKALEPPVITKEVDRMVAIITDSPARFIVADSNVQANPAPLHYIEYFEQVTKNANRIREAAARHSIDPDIVRAIIWMESTRGYYDSGTGLVLKPKTILPMNVWLDYWTGFKVTREGLQDPAINIDTGTKILARIKAKTSGGSIAKIATLYGNLAAQKESEYGKTVEYYYNTKPWLKPSNN